MSDFAQNLKLSSKKETSEEYFHQKQISMFGIVSTVDLPCQGGNSQQHSLSQITTSDNKWVKSWSELEYKDIIRTKDSAWVYACLDQSLPDALTFAEKHGQKIDMKVHMVRNNYIIASIGFPAVW